MSADNPTSISSCIFCQIIKKASPANIVYEDHTIIIFTDLHPTAKHHYLIVPKRHIDNAKRLVKDDIPLVEFLISKAHNVIESQVGDLHFARFGFHWPPFNSISHLHLHAICPTTDLSFLSRIIFKPDSYWFVSPEYVLDRLQVE